MADKTSPKSSLRLEWVYGYRGNQCRNNLYYTLRKDVVYFVAGVGVVLNPREHKQKFFLGHDDDIVSLALHPDRVHVATGQIGKEVKICVWDSDSTQTVSILKPDHQHGVISLAFDKSGDRLASVGMDGKSTITIWDWKKARAIATVTGHTDKVFDIRFNPYKDNSLVSVGVKHIKFWSLCGNTMTAKKGVFGKVGDIQTQLCVTFGQDDVTYSGTMSGDVYMWKGSTLDRVIEAHKGALHSIDATEDGFATGAKDGSVRLWDTEFKPLTSVDLTDVTNGYKGLVVRSVCWRGDTILAGTQDSEIFEITVRARDNPECLVQGHAEGELWALAVHPKKPIFVTGSDDHTLRLWSMTEREALNQTTLDSAIRSCAVNDDGSHVAVGLMDGSFMVLKTKDLSEVIHVKDRKEVIHEMKYSPDGKHLAVGSNDNFVDIYAVGQLYKKVGQCSGSSSFITHLDWSEDSKCLQTNSGARERLFYRMPGGKQLTNADEIRALRWASFTGVLGPEVSGIWAKYSDVTDVNAADANFGSECVVTGDDFGLVKLFRFPSLKKGAKFKKYVGHSAHVTNVRFSHDKRRVITTGGSDHAVFQWKFTDSTPDGAAANGDAHGMADSDSEASDSDLSDVAELDSDIETEQQVSYDRGIEKGDMKLLKKQIKSEMTPGEKRNKPPNSGLKLTYVHGYRGYDCRNNLFYTPAGDVIYHVAAVGVVYQREKHQQTFYLEHTDDILCLCINPMKDVAATGQVGRDPTIHVWDFTTMKTLSILKGSHQRGVCAVDFTADGKKLASVGLDDDHTIVVWDWKKGEALASTRGHKGKIFVVKCNPYDPLKLVTVGDKHIKFWTQTGGGFTSSRGTFGDVGKQDTMMCAVYGKDADTCFTGGARGEIHVWAGHVLQKVIKAHEGPCFAMHSLDKGFVTGGKDGVVSLWDEQFERCLKQYAIKHSALAPGSRGTLVQDSPSVRSVVLGHGHILVGTRNSEILEIDKAGPMNVLVQGHQEKELWGLCTHPTKPICATVSDDKTLRLWSLGEDHKMINCKLLKKPGRCVHYSPDGKALAVGFNDGSFVVVNADTLEDMVTYHHRKEEISDIKFSPDQGKYLAVASHDNFVDIYNVLSSKRVGVCKGPSSYITHIDWDQKGKLLMVNSGAKELLYFEAPRGKIQPISRDEAANMRWASWTGVLGQTCDGIWPPKSDVTDVNATDVTKDRQLMATADDFGYVKLFNYPSIGKFAKFKKYVGHSAHVTNVRWTFNDELLVSVGGADTALMVWRHIGMAERVVARGDSDDSDSDSEEEGGYDSDVQREKNMDYSAKTYTKSIRDTDGVKPQLQEFDLDDSPAVSRQVSAPPRVSTKQTTEDGKKKKTNKISSLTLSHVFGYRGFDCRQNLVYVNEGADLVYHAAGAGIVQHKATGKQSFYLEHTDDVICLAVNRHIKHKNVVATGQIGAKAAIHIWDAVTKATLSIIKGYHEQAVVSLNFSYSGKLLVSVDMNGNVAVWRWQEATKTCSAEASSSRIFHAEFRPDSDQHFVTVGVNHVKFWTIAGGELLGKRGVVDVLPNGDVPKMQTMLSVAFSANYVTFTGAMSGDVYVWKENLLAKIVRKAHTGPVFCLYTTLSDGLIVSGGKERVTKDGGAIKLWDQEMKRCKPFQVNNKEELTIVKSVCREKGRILVGTNDGSVLEVTEKSGNTECILSCHGEGELWGLGVHPSSDQFVTASDDGTVRIWDAVTKTMTHKLQVGPARSACYSHDGDYLAVGLKNGEFVLMKASSLKLVAKKRDRNLAINDIRFSPDNRYLAVGSEANCVDFYDVSQGPPLNRTGYCKGIPSFVIQMDFSADSKYIRVSTGSYELQIFEVPSGNPVTDKNKIANITWATWTSTLGPDMVGVWPKEAENAEVNCACVNHGGNSVVTGDDFGLVKLFNFPSQQKMAKHQSYVGHSAHVTNARFTSNDKYLITTGGDDCCVFVWSCK